MISHVLDSSVYPMAGEFNLGSFCSDGFAGRGFGRLRLLLSLLVRRCGKQRFLDFVSGVVALHRADVGAIVLGRGGLTLPPRVGSHGK